jgi:hypothetical protein
MGNKREAEDNSETAASCEGQGQPGVVSEAERQLRIGRTIMQEYRSTLSALARGEQEKEQDQP